MRVYISCKCWERRLGYEAEFKTNQMSIGLDLNYSIEHYLEATSRFTEGYNFYTDAIFVPFTV
jgi:hypothetical protein